MTGDIDLLRQALNERAQAIALPPGPSARDVRDRARSAGLRRATAIAASVLLVVGLVAVVQAPSSRSSRLGTSLGSSDAGSPAHPSSSEGTRVAETDAAGSPEEQPAARGRDSSPATSAPNRPTASPATSSTTTSQAQQTGAEPSPTAAEFALAEPGPWWYRIHGHRSDGIIGSGDFASEAYLRVLPAEGRSQRVDGGSNKFEYFTVRDATYAKDRAVAIREMTLWGRDDTPRTFVLDGEAFEVPPRDRWDRESRFSATSTHGSTRVQVTVRVDGTETLTVPRDGVDGPVETVRVVSVITASGDRTLTASRTVWWATDLGMAARVHEKVTGTTSSGKQLEVETTANLVESKPSPEPLNRQVEDAAGS